MEQTEDFVIIYTTVPDRGIAGIISKSLIKGELIACANILPVDSIYKWKGEVVEDGEYLIIIKTHKNLYDEVENIIKELHPYEVPEIISFSIEKGLADYLKWIENNTKINNS